MGSIVSLIQQGIGLARDVEAEEAREKNRHLQLEADRLRHPIVPPEKYSTLSERRKKVPSGPYSVDGIRKSLKSGVIPVGYSLELLAAEGFGPEVADFKNSDVKVLQGFKEQLSKIIGLSADKLEQQVKSQYTDPQIRRDLEKVGAGQSEVDELRDFARQALTDEFDEKALSAFIKTAQSRIDAANDYQLAREAEAEQASQLQDASESAARRILSMEANGIRERLLKNLQLTTQPNSN